MTEEYKQQLIEELEKEIQEDPLAFDHDDKHEFGFGFHE